MQMFNGITMGVFSPYMVNFDPDSDPAQSQETYETSQNKQLNKIKNEISELTDKIAGSEDLNTENDKIEIQGILNTEFANYLKQHTDIAKALLDAVNNIDVGGNSDNRKARDDLIKFLTPIAEPSFDNQKVLNLDNIAKSEEPPANPKFYKNIDKAPEGKKTLVEEAKDKIANLKTVYDDVLKTETSINSTLTKLEEVLQDPSESNVKILQQAILNNIPDDDNKKVFLKKNGGGSIEEPNFDGKFGDSTLKGMNKLVNDVENHLKDLKAANDVIKENDAETLNSVTAKAGEIKANKNSKPEDWLQGLPDGAKVEFNDDAEKAKLDTAGEQTIKLKVTLGDATKEIDVTVNVSEAEADSPAEQEPSGPLEIGEGDNKTTYQVIDSSSVLAAGTTIPGATFYYTTTTEQAPTAGEQAGENSDLKTGEYYMKMSGKTELYKVKLENGFLYPIITKVDPKTGKEIGKDLIANNESCRCYLQNKLPNEIKDDCQIGWVNKGERIKVGNNYYGELGNNYYLISHEGVVTIEPMTIAGDWISKDLGKNLAFLNLTNYIRNEGDKRGKPDPDVNRKVDKYRGIRDNNGKRLKINKSAFGLDGASDEELARFKRYNNGEHWEDNWDKKRKNKDYGRVAINIG